MKKLTSAIAILAMALITACSGSDTYRGDWKATNNEGLHFNITFEAKSFSIEDPDGEVKNFEYTQNSVSIENSEKTYGIVTKEGPDLQIIFPGNYSDAIGMIADKNGDLVFTISRDEFLTYDEAFGIN